MKKAKRLLSAVLILCVLFGCAACGAETAAESTLTDAAGRTVTLRGEPKRIVSGYYISTSMLIALGAADRLVGIEAKAEKRPIYALAAPELLELPNVGSAKDFNLEAAIGLEPDLVILPVKLADAAETLSELGIRVLLVSPESREDMAFTLRLLGKACGEEKRAEELLTAIAKGEDRLTGLLEGTEAKRVYLAGNSSFLRTAGAGMYQNEVLTLAGTENAAADLKGNGWTEISLEEFAACDPDAIVIASDAEYAPRDLEADETAGSLRAVREGAVYVLPDGIEAWDSPVPGAFLGSWYVAKSLYPELVSEEDYEREVTEFYENWYDFTPEGSFWTA